MTTNVLFLPGVYNTGWSLMITYPLIGAGMALVIFSVIRDESFLFSRFVRSRTIGYLGKISYGLYIFHVTGNIIAAQILMNVLGISLERLASSRIITFAIGLLLTILLSSFSYHWLEKPFLRMKEKFSLITSRPM